MREPRPLTTPISKGDEPTTTSSTTSPRFSQPVMTLPVILDG